MFSIICLSVFLSAIVVAPCDGITCFNMDVTECAVPEPKCLSIRCEVIGYTWQEAVIEGEQARYAVFQYSCDNQSGTWGVAIDRDKEGCVATPDSMTGYPGKTNNPYVCHYTGNCSQSCFVSSAETEVGLIQSQRKVGNDWVAWEGHWSKPYEAFCESGATETADAETINMGNCTGNVRNCANTPP